MAAIYFFFIASDMYVSTAQFAIRNPDQNGGIGGDLLGFIMPGASSSTTADSYLVARYLETWDMFSRVNQQLDIISHFSNLDHDFKSRLRRDSSQHDILAYWNWVAKIDFDPDSGIITSEVKAYTPEMARDINALVIDTSERLVNEMNERAHADAIKMAKSEVALAEERLQESHAKMRALRESTTILDPTATAQTIQSLIGSLELEAARVAAELAESRTYMRDNSPKVEGLQRRLEAIKAQLEQERGKLTSLAKSGGATTDPDAGPGLTSVVGEFEDARLAEEFAFKQYTAALSSLEMARIKASSKSRYLVPFEPPVLPDESRYPEPFYFTFLTLVGSILALALGALIIASIREHAGF